MHSSFALGTRAAPHPWTPPHDMPDPLDPNGPCDLAVITTDHRPSRLALVATMVAARLP